MDSYIEKNQTLTEFVSEEHFNETIRTFLDKRQDKEKPLWTRERIEEAITAIEQFKLAPLLKLQRTHKQYYYEKKYDIMKEGTEKCLILKRRSNSDPVVKIVPTENFHQILGETHQSTGHGGRDKMLSSLKSKYLIPTSVVLEFLKLCTVCQSKKRIPRKGIFVCPIVSSDFNHRGQVDLVDLQSTPDRNYKWLLHYQDHATKFSFLRPLTSSIPAEVAMELLKIFLEVGCPRILQSDNGREFTAVVIQELTKLWSTCKIVNGISTHLASQGSVERSNQDVEAMLRAWLIDNDTKNWAMGCYFVQFQKNASFHQTIKRSPYKALFGTEPKTGLQSSHIPKELLEKLVTEEDLDLLLNRQDHDIIVTPEDLPITSTSKCKKPASELIHCNASTSNDLSIVKSANNNTSMSHDLPATNLLNKKVSKLKDLPEMESISLSTTRQLKPVNDTTLTVKTEAAVSYSKACCVVCGTDSTGVRSCDICKNPVQAICGNTVAEEGCESKIHYQQEKRKKDTASGKMRTSYADLSKEEKEKRRPYQCYNRATSTNEQMKRKNAWQQKNQKIKITSAEMKEKQPETENIPHRKRPVKLAHGEIDNNVNFANGSIKLSNVVIEQCETSAIVKTEECTSQSGDLDYFEMCDDWKTNIKTE